MERPGQSLGGSAVPVSPSELRRRRLAAFEGQQNIGGDNGPTTTTTTPTPTPVIDKHQPTLDPLLLSPRNPPSPPAHIVIPMNHASSVVNIDDDDNEVEDVDHDYDDEDSELQAALAMSLQQHHQTMEEISEPLLTPPPPQQKQYQHSLQDLEDLAQWWKTHEAADVCSFHEIMWDSQVTTENDKIRWVGQGVDLREAMMGPDSSQQPQPMEITSTTSTTSSSSLPESVLTIIGSDHRPWGLQQSHGGPCGVLAAIQAEMLRILLFGRRGNALDFPVQPGQGVATTASHDSSSSIHGLLSPDTVRRALAMSIAIILARAAFMPTVTSVVQSGSDTEQQTQPVSDGKKSARLVLPIHPSEAGLGWHDLEPWESHKESSTPQKSATLRMYTISPFSDDHTSMSSHKRQKINGSQDVAIVTVSSQEGMIIRLAQAVTTFLLHPSSIASGECPLDSFQRPGGVVLMVMSLVFSRGQTIISQDMDYPTMLTSQFGHCGQELINLLLTGQAVSNVFDNSLTPSGELTCRGIQARPAVGYLSQLESMRYCEVGGYYKSPKFPIWVVGSTSHFTVLFGDESCLKESKSDILLEKCRRAFKAVEGGDENGFIATTSLEHALKSLDLDVGGDHAVQTLAAALEVSGAGIILWDDFWKATSRLLTGASLESVLHMSNEDAGRTEGAPPVIVLTEEDDRKQTTEERDAAMAQQPVDQWGHTERNTERSLFVPPARPGSPMEVDPAADDEQLARRLQAQWDAEASGTASTAASAGGSPASSSQWKDTTTDDDNNTNHAVADDVTTLTIFDDSKVVSFTGKTALDRVEEESPTKHNFETFGDSFMLCHYNGLRGGTLTPFRVTRLTPEEAVGASIALNRGNSNSAAHSGGGSSGDLEDIVRTKWPSCVINWLGKSPPYVD